MPGSYTVLQKIELEQLATLKTLGAGETSYDTSVIYYYKINKLFGFVGPTGAALTANDSVTFYYYRKPKSNGTETISDAIIPIIDDRWDDYLAFRACFELTADPKWLALSEAELRRCRTLQLAEIDRTWTIPVNREYD
jgi:hypothetical protein